MTAKNKQRQRQQQQQQQIPCGNDRKKGKGRSRFPSFGYAQEEGQKKSNSKDATASVRMI